MTRIFTDGAEMQDISFWDITLGVSVASATPAISPYYYINNAQQAYKNFAALSECYLRVRYRSNNVNNTSPAFPSFRLDATVVAALKFNATGHFQASVTTVGVVGTSLMVADNNTWYLIEVWFKEDNAPNGKFVVYVDGNLVIDYTGDTQPATATTFNNFYFDQNGGVQGMYDDLALNDTAGVVDNSWCGDGIVVKITPSGSGTVNNFLNSGSTSGSSNYTYVDEFPSDGDTSNVYVSASSTGDKDQYRMSTFDGAGKNILRIYPEARIRKTRGDSSTIELGYLPSGGTDQLSGSQTVGIAYSAVVGTSASANPVTGLAWTASDLNLLEYIIKK